MRISVVIPCFNRQDRIARAVRSALEQTLPPHEVIVIDDGSTDGSADVAARLGERVRVIRTANGGPAAARNVGISESTGDWIAFLDSDDQWAADKLARQADACQRFPRADLIFCDTRTVCRNQVLSSSRFGLGGLYGAEIQASERCLRFDRHLFLNMIEQSRVITSAVMVRSGLPRLQFPSKLRYSEDWALWLDLILDSEFVAVDDILVTMHHEGDNLTARGDRILRHDVIVLEDLLHDQRLNVAERELVTAALKRRRVAAIYHSLLAGEGSEVRRLLGQVSANDLSMTRRIGYRIASLLPGKYVRALSALRN